MKSTLKNENTPGGRTFKVTITETYQRTITVYESEMKEHFQGVEFTGREDGEADV